MPGHLLGVCLTFKKLSVFKVIVPFYIPSSHHENWHSLAKAQCGSLFNCSHFDLRVVILHCNLNLHFLNNWCSRRTSFPALVCHSNLFLHDVPFQIFALKKNGLFVFLLSSFGSSFHILDTVQYFLQPVTCLHFLNGVFQREDLNFDASNLSIFFLHRPWFWCCSENECSA